MAYCININTRHDFAPEKVFTLVLLEPEAKIPVTAAESIDLGVNADGTHSL